MIIFKRSQCNFKVPVTLKLYYPDALKFIQEKKCDVKNMH